jgi:hypothetical protein
LEQCPSPFLPLPKQYSGGQQPVPAERAQLQNILNNGPLEIRANDGEKWWSGVFDDYLSLRSELAFALNRGMDVYNTINPVDLRPTNKLKPRQRSTKDVNIARIKILPFDFDPIREKGQPATEGQIELARETAQRLITFLGWGDPVQAMSGNGWHLLYEVDMPNDSETAKVLKDLYLALALRFSTGEINFDSVVRNPARIMRTYGTVNQKSGRKTYCMLPESRSAVTSEAVCELAKKLTPKKPTRTWVRKPTPETTGKGYIKNLDVAGVFIRSGLYLQETTESGKHWVICPWEDEHSQTGPTDTVIWEGKWPQFLCSHDHCSHRTILDVINFMGVSS